VKLEFLLQSIEEGDHIYDGDMVEAARPLETETKANPYFDARADGVYNLVEKENKSTGEAEREWIWFCWPLDVAAETRDIDGENWGRFLVVKDRAGAEHEWALPMELLAGSGEEYRRYPEQADRLVRIGVDQAEDLNHPYSQAVAGIVRTFVYALLRDVERTRIHAEKTIQVATNYELPFFLAFGTVYRGRTLVLRGSVEDGMAEICYGLDMPVPKTEAWWPFALVDICLDAGL
jgi:hypothetical protein